MLEEILKNMPEIAGEDILWFITDKDGHIAMFASMGWGVVPIITLLKYEENICLFDYFSSIKESRTVNFLTDPKNIDEECINIAKCGIFYYSYDDEKKDGNYHLWICPEKPLMLTELSLHWQFLLNKIKVKDTCFIENYKIMPHKHINCIGSPTGLLMALAKKSLKEEDVIKRIQNAMSDAGE